MPMISAAFWSSRKPSAYSSRLAPCRGSRGTLAELEATHETVYVENLGTDREFIGHDPAGFAGRGSYFALLIVKAHRPAQV